MYAKTTATLAVFATLALPAAAEARPKAYLSMTRAQAAIARALPRTVTVSRCHRLSRTEVRCYFVGPLPEQDEPGWVEEGYATAYEHRTGSISVEVTGLP